MIRVVFDTVVFVRALINPKSRCGRLVFERFREYELILSPEIIREALEVIRRPEVSGKSPHFGSVMNSRLEAASLSLPFRHDDTGARR